MPAGFVGMNDFALGIEQNACLEHPVRGMAMDSARERLLDAADVLIYRNGVHATGTQAILEAAGVARMSLYHHFGSKEALVVAALERRDDRWMRWFSEAVDAHGTDARERILGMFGVLQEWFAKPDFHGCVFISVCGEGFERDHPVRAVARRAKERLRAFILELCQGAGVPRAELLAQQLFLLVDGAIVAALVEPKCTAAADARSAAATLLKARIN
jgi:AcrR family transcriptional regulator